MHYVPLRTRKRDYPKTTANGAKRTTTEHIKKVLQIHKPRSKAFKALLLTLKDSGLRIGDTLNQNCNIILENPNKDFIHLTIKTEKTDYIAKTFLGTDAINALKEYIEERRKGTRKRPPENITNNTPLFVKWKKPYKRMERNTATVMIKCGFKKIGERKMSPHSFRKKLQTDLEKAGVNPNWIDHILGHQLVNSRDAYSLPTDEELFEAYKKAYPTIQIIPTQTNTTTPTDTPFAEAKTIDQCKDLILKGYKFELNHNGTSLFRKPTNTQTD